VAGKRRDRQVSAAAAFENFVKMLGRRLNMEMHGHQQQLILRRQPQERDADRLGY